MAIKIGTSDLAECHIGTAEYTKIYIGTALAWEKSSGDVTIFDGSVLIGTGTTKFLRFPSTGSLPDDAYVYSSPSSEDSQAGIVGNRILVAQGTFEQYGSTWCEGGAYYISGIDFASYRTSGYTTLHINVTYSGDYDPDYPFVSGMKKLLSVDSSTASTENDLDMPSATEYTYMLSDIPDNAKVIRFVGDMEISKIWIT